MSKMEFAPDALAWLGALARAKNFTRSAALLARDSGISPERAADIERGFLIADIVERIPDQHLRLTPEGHELVKGLNLNAVIT